MDYKEFKVEGCQWFAKEKKVSIVKRDSQVLRSCAFVAVQRLLQTGPPPRPEAKLLQRLQPHGALSTLSHVGHALRETAIVLLHPPAAGDTLPPDVAIARGPHPSHQVTTTTIAARSDGGLGPGIAVARTGRPTSRRVLPTAVDACAVDVSFDLYCYLLHF